METTFIEILNNFGLPVAITTVSVYALYKGVKAITSYLLKRDIKNTSLESEFREYLKKANEEHHQIFMKNTEVFEILIKTLTNVEKLLK